MPVVGRIDSASLTSDAIPPCGNCQRSKAQCLYQVVRHLDAGFLTMNARSRMAGSRPAPQQDRGEWNGGTVQTFGSNPRWPLGTGRVLPFLGLATWVPPSSSSRPSPPRRVPRASMSSLSTEEMLSSLPRFGEGQMPKEKPVPVLAVIRGSFCGRILPKQPRMLFRASVSSDRRAQVWSDPHAPGNARPHDSSTSATRTEKGLRIQ
jgi:hypothetical protein